MASWCLTKHSCPVSVVWIWRLTVASDRPVMGVWSWSGTSCCVTTYLNLVTGPVLKLTAHLWARHYVGRLLRNQLPGQILSDYEHSTQAGHLIREQMDNHSIWIFPLVILPPSGQHSIRMVSPPPPPPPKRWGGGGGGVWEEHLERGLLNWSSLFGQAESRINNTPSGGWISEYLNMIVGSGMSAA